MPSLCPACGLAYQPVEAVRAGHWRLIGHEPIPVCINCADPDMNPTHPPSTITHTQLVQGLHLVFHDRALAADARSVQALADFVRDLSRTLKLSEAECAAVLGPYASPPATASPPRAEQPPLFRLPSEYV